MKKTNRSHQQNATDERTDDTETADDQGALTGGAAIVDEKQESSALDGGSTLNHLDETGDAETADTEEKPDDETAPSTTETEP